MLDNWQENVINIQNIQPGAGAVAQSKVLTLHEDLSLLSSASVTKPGVVVWAVILVLERWGQEDSWAQGPASLA